MALNTLTLDVNSGIQGRAFSAAIVGRSAGSRLDALSEDGKQRFYVLNDRLYNDALPYASNVVTLRETLAGEGTKDTVITIAAYSIDNPAPQTPPDGTALVADGAAVSVTDSTGSSDHSGTASVDGNTLDSVALPATAAMVDNGAAATLYLSSGFNAGSGTVGVAEGHLTGVTLPAGTGVVSDGLNVIISKADNTGLLTTGIAHVDSNDEFENVALPQNYAVIQDGIGNFDVLDFGSGQGAVAVIARVSNNSPDVQLANATTKIAINAAPAQVTGGAKTVGITLAVDQGLWEPFPLVSATDAIIQNSDTVPVQNSAGAAIGTGTVTVAASAVSSVRLPATIAGIANAGTVAVRNSAGGDSHNATAVVATGALTGVNLAATVAMVDNAAGMQVPVTGTYTNTITATVANGVITGFTLS